VLAGNDLGFAQHFESDQPSSEDSNSNMSEPPRRAPWLGYAARGKSPIQLGGENPSLKTTCLVCAGAGKSKHSRTFKEMKFSLRTSKFESDMPSHAVGLADVQK
jgi:hypothetical protein